MLAELHTLMAILPPPPNPVGLERQWEDIEHELGTALPSDYKSFVDLYGSGTICGHLYVWNLRDRRIFSQPLLEVLKGAFSQYECVLSGDSDGVKYALFPKADGLLPFGKAFDIDHLNWFTVGPSDEWDVVYWEGDELEFVHLKGDSFVQFLIKTLRNEYHEHELAKYKHPYTFTPDQR